MNGLNKSVTNVSNSFKEFNDKIMALGKDIDIYLTTYKNITNPLVDFFNIYNK